MNLFLCLLTVAYNREMQPFYYCQFFVGEKIFRVWVLNLTVRSGRVRRSRVRAGFGLQF